LPVPLPSSGIRLGERGEDVFVVVVFLLLLGSVVIADYGK
jgi:hypothetical protein